MYQLECRQTFWEVPTTLTQLQKAIVEKTCGAHRTGEKPEDKAGERQIGYPECLWGQGKCTNGSPYTICLNMYEL